MEKIWQIAGLDCDEDREEARRKLGAILACVTAYIMGNTNPAKRGVPPQYQEAVSELRRRFSTRQGDADAALVNELGLLDYLAGRLAVSGTPEECLTQVRRAEAAGTKRLMFTVSVASDPLHTVQLFGEKVLPAIRAAHTAALSGPLTSSIPPAAITSAFPRSTRRRPTTRNMPNRTFAPIANSSSRIRHCCKASRNFPIT